jgi:hypothetical protein
MYVLSRLLLMVSALAMVAGAAGLVALTWPASLFVLVLIAVLSRRRRRQLTSHGSARWMSAKELSRCGLLGDDGFILGYHVSLDAKD